MQRAALAVQISATMHPQRDTIGRLVRAAAGHGEPDLDLHLLRDLEQINADVRSRLALLTELRNKAGVAHKPASPQTLGEIVATSDSPSAAGSAVNTLLSCRPSARASPPQRRCSADGNDGRAVIDTDVPLNSVCSLEGSRSVPTLLDVWNFDTFDQELVAQLRANAALVASYLAADHELFMELKSSRDWNVLRTNPFATTYQRFVESLAPLMELRTIRGWHYTRLTDNEVDALLTLGIRMSTQEATRQRLDAQVAAHSMSRETADAIFAQSPLHDPQQPEARSSCFWVRSHPSDVTNMDVTLLLENWSGEVVYFWLDVHPHLQEVVSRIGRARVIEVAVQLDATRHTYSASRAVAATFARTLGCRPDFAEFDFFV
jgi:hypothetical protein